MLKGLPGSGKSKWAKNQCECETDTVRVNKDDIRAMMVSDFSKSNESIVLNVRDTLVGEALSRDKTVIVDDTNFAPIHEKTLRMIAENWGADFKVKMFDTPVDECIKRDAARANPVGRAVIMDMYRKYIKQVPESVKYVKGLPIAIIVDIDGTLAHMTVRSPYDYSKVDTDIVDEVVKNLVNYYRFTQHQVIIVSGRKDECYVSTSMWLAQNNIRHEALYMRKTNDNRPDYIVKREIYEKHIKGQYNITVVLDDRDQVVRMWREEGLKVLQVAEGNF